MKDKKKEGKNYKKIGNIVHFLWFDNKLKVDD